MESLSEDLLSLIFSYVFTAKDLCQCTSVCRKWKNLLDSRNDIWQRILDQSTPSEFREDALLRGLQSARAKLIAFECGWSEVDHSENIYVKENKLTLHRNPVAQSTDAIRGKAGFSSGEHYWIITWHGPNFGSSAIVGIATKHARIQEKGYVPLLGGDDQSWGWDLSESVIRYGGEVLRKYPSDSAIKAGIGQKIGVNLDANRGTLAFDIEGKYLGIAFFDLPHNVPLYPAVSAVYGNTEVSLVYCGTPIVG